MDKNSLKIYSQVMINKKKKKALMKTKKYKLKNQQNKNIKKFSTKSKGHYMIKKLKL